MTLKPLADYSGYEHVLGSEIAFVHPISGNIYACACEKKGGINQDFSVYRWRPTGTAWELVKRYLGGVDVVGQCTMGSIKIARNGSLWVSFSAAPKDNPTLTKTGFQALWDVVPNVDLPWGGVQEGAQGEQGPPGPPGPQGEPGSGASLDDEQGKALAWLVRLLRRLEVLL